jgi:hypothetical protein
VEGGPQSARQAANWCSAPSVPGEIDELGELQEEGEALLPVVRAAREYAESQGQPVTTEILAGPPADTIVRVSSESGIDLLVIGQSGDDLNADWRHVAQRAPCPVFVARETVVARHEGPPEHRTEHWEVRRDRRDRLEGPGRMMRVFVGENDRIDARPVYEFIVQRLRAIDVAGATVYRGVLDHGAAGRLHRSHFFSHDQPVIVTAVDTVPAIEAAIDAVQDLVTSGLIVCSDVQIVKYSHTHPVGVTVEGPGRTM